MQSFDTLSEKTRGSLREIVEDEPKKIDDIAEQLKTIVKKHCEKGLLSLSFVQRLLFGLLYELYPSTSVKSRDLSLLMLPYVKEVAPAMCTTRKGTQSLVRCIAYVVFERGVREFQSLKHALRCQKYSKNNSLFISYSSLTLNITTRIRILNSRFALEHRYATAKDRKRIVKCFKDDLFKESEPGLAQHPFAHLALLKLLDVVDDTKLLRKFILKSLKENLEIACFDRYARKLLLHILSPRNTKYFTPSDIEMLAKIHVEMENGEKSSMSRKEDSVRQSELLSDIRDALKSFCEANADKMSRSRLASDVLVKTASHNMSVSSLVNAAFSSSSSSSSDNSDDEDAEETILMCDRTGQRTVSRI